MTSRMNSLKGQSFFSGLSSAVFNLEFGSPISCIIVVTSISLIVIC